MRNVPHLAKQIGAVERQADANHVSQLRLERVDRRIRMRPWIRQRPRIEFARHRADVFELQHPRALGDQQPDRQLNRRDVLDKVEAIDRVKQIDVTRQRRPRSKRYEGWRERYPFTTAQIDGAFEIELLRNDRKDYARTCMAWLKRLRAARPQAVDLVGADVVSRYERYLQLSTLGFETGNLLLLRITLRRID